MFLINDIYSENCILLNSFSRRFIDIEAWPLLTFFLCLYNQLISIHSILLHIKEYRCLKNEIHQIDRNSFFYQGSLLLTLTIHRAAGEGRVLSLFRSTTSTRSQTFTHLFATLHLRWVSRIFNRNACVYHTATRWDLPHYWITIWLIDWWCNVCLFTWWFNSRFLLQQFDTENRWIWTRIDYHPSITSEPTNQVLLSAYQQSLRQNLSWFLF